MTKRKKNPNVTQIQVTIETRDRLKELGIKGTKYEEIITMLLDHYAK